MMRKRTSNRKTLCLERLEDRCCPSSYSVVDLGTLGGTSSIAEDINVSGQVVGQAYRPGDVGPQGNAFLWQNGTMTDLGTLGGTVSDAHGINKFTQVVGAADTGAVDAGGNAISHPFLWQNGVMTDLGTLGGTRSSGAAWDINTSGKVVGDAGGAFVWQNGVMTDLNSLLPANSGWILSRATGINDNGQITGNGSHNGFQRAFLLSSGVITDLGNLGGPGSSIAHGLNNSGQVVGLGSASNIQSFAFLYSGGVMTNLGSIGGGSSADSEAFDINSTTQVVGLSTHGTSGLLDPHAALWQNGQITDLNKVIAKNSGWVLSKAFGINDTGCIVGWGSINNQHHAFLAIPPGMAPTSLASGTSGKPVALEVALRADASVVPGGPIPAQSNGIGLATTPNLASLTTPPDGPSAAGIIVAAKQTGPKSTPSTGASFHQVRERIFADFDSNPFADWLATASTPGRVG